MSDDEIVALYDPATSSPAGSAPRSRVRRENLPHGATGVLVRRSNGQVLMHRRSTTKDLWPGYVDCAFGGVLLAGEQPEVGARRELAEEAGIDDPSVPLEPLLVTWYRDADTWYLAHVYVAVWDGPVQFSDGEVDAAWWSDADTVRAALADAATPFVPDTRALLGLLPAW